MNREWIRDELKRHFGKWSWLCVYEPRMEEAAKVIAEKLKNDWGAVVSCDTTECLYNNRGECAQDEIHLNAYQMCESVDMG